MPIAKTFTQPNETCKQKFQLYFPTKCVCNPQKFKNVGRLAEFLMEE